MSLFMELKSTQQGWYVAIYRIEITFAGLICRYSFNKMSMNQNESTLLLIIDQSITYRNHHLQVCSFLPEYPRTSDELLRESQTKNSLRNRNNGRTMTCVIRHHLSGGTLLMCCLRQLLTWRSLAGQLLTWWPSGQFQICLVSKRLAERRVCARLYEKAKA